MGWKSTRDLSRNRVLAEIEERLAGASDDALCDVLDTLVHDERRTDRTAGEFDSLHGHNFRIVE